MDITLKNESASVVCQTFGAELLSYRTAEGKEYIWQRDEAYWGKSSPVLFPFVGPVVQPVTIYGKSYDMPKHGFVKEAEFEIAEQGEDFVILKTGTSEFSSSVYPYEFEFTVTFRLNGAELEVIYGVVNKSDEKMPFLIGGHPAFFCPMEDGAKFTDYMLHFADEDKADVHLTYPMFDNDAIFFDGFQQHTVELIHQDTKKGIHFEFPDYLSVAFWTPIKKNAPFLCIEPWNSGTIEQVPNTNMLEKKYVQYLSAGQSRDYRFSFFPC